MAPAYTLSIAVELRRALDGFPTAIKNEIQQRIENTLALPVSHPADQVTTIEVEGHKATLRLDPLSSTVHVIDLYSPRFGWAKPKTA